MHKNNERLARLADLLIKYTALDFSDRAPVSANHDEIDAIATGLNVLAEELRASMEKEKKQAQDIQRLNAELEKKVSERTQELQTALQRSRHAQEIAHVGHWELDLGTWQSNWSDEAFRIYGIPPGTTEGSYQLFLSAVHPDDLEMVKDITKKALQTLESFSYYHRIITRNEEVRHILASGEFELDPSGKPVKLFGVAVDVTELKEKEARLKQVNKELETFVYKSSHDLRGPLASILGLVNIAETEPDDQAKKYISAIGGLTRKLDDLLLKLVHVMSVRDKQQNLSEVNLAELVSSIMSSLEFTGGFRKIKFNVSNDVSGLVITDKEAVFSVLLNLIENSIKYHDYAKESPEVDITIHKNGTPNVHIEIKDNGLGIAEESKDKIFDMFYRGNDRSKGSGLGLYIVKATIEKLGGIIEVESQKGIGTTFRIRLPITVPALVYN